MAQLRRRRTLQHSSENPSDEVLILADAVGSNPTTLAQVMAEFLKIVPRPLIAGGFAMAHHGVVRATVDIDVLAIGSIQPLFEKFKALGYKHESMALPIGAIDLFTKGNKGVDFIHLDNAAFLQSIIKRAVTGTFVKREVHFVSLEDLILLKYLAVGGRDNKFDAADLDKLLLKPYDLKYVKSWKAKLNLP